jgi:hypothetical protein
MRSKNINMDRYYEELIDGKFVGIPESHVPASDRKGERANIVGEPFELSRAALSAVGIIQKPSDSIHQTFAPSRGRHVARPGEIEPKLRVSDSSDAGELAKQ